MQGEGRRMLELKKGTDILAATGGIAAADGARGELPDISGT